MSQENVELIRRTYDVWNESGPAAVTERFWAEDAIYRERLGQPGVQVYRGRDAALGRMRGLLELVGPMQVRLDDLVEADDGRIVACVQLVGPEASDSPYTRSFAVVHRLCDGLIVEADYYLDRAQALQAAGLSE
jgi:ketosteroid isomerase-like protein